MRAPTHAFCFAVLSLTLLAGCGKKGETSRAAERTTDRRGLEPEELTANQELATAVLNAQTGIARRALAEGGNPNLMLPSGATLLTHAITANLPDLVELLLEVGADPTRRDLAGMSPLILAIQGRYDGVAMLLIQKGALLEERDPQGRTPLLLALQLDRLALAEWLIDVHDMDGRTPLQTARDKNLDALERIMQLRLQMSGDTPVADLLAGLLYNGDAVGLNMLVAQDATVLNVALAPGPVARAVIGVDESRVPAVLAVLFGLRLSPNGATGDVRTPLMEAARLNRVAILDVLVKNGADLEKKDALGLSALHHAVATLWPEAVEYLLEAGARANYRVTIHGQTTEKKACDVARAATPVGTAERERLDQIMMHLRCGYRRLIFW